MKVIFIGVDGQHSVYQSEKHSNLIKKFIVFNRDGVKLLAGNQSTHADLICAYGKIIISDGKPFPLPREGEMTAAGNCLHGSIIGWNSVYFDVFTPEDMKEEIKKLLQMEEK